MTAKIVILVITLAFLFITSFFYDNKSFTHHFFDEDLNFSIGKFLETNYKLYSDLSINHQPMAFILSGKIQQLTEPNSIYLLLKRHREFVIAYSFIWGVFLVYFFGIPMFLTLVVFEMTKYFFLGHLFLAENFSVYPCIYISGLILQQRYLTKFHLVFIGLLLSFLIVMLAPVWPLAFLFFLLVLFQGREYLKKIIYLFIGGLPLIIISLIYTSIPDYYRDVFYFNAKYLEIAKMESVGIVSILKSFLTPLIAILSKDSNTNTLLIIKLLSLLLLGTFFYLIRQGLSKVVLISFFILGFANLRFFPPGEEFYRGFHLIIWYGLLVSMAFLLVSKNFRKFKNLTKIFISIIIVTIILISFYKSWDGLFLTRDRDKDLYIEYSENYSVGSAINIMSNNGEFGEKLFVSSDEWLIYWVANIKPYREFGLYYPWMNAVFEYRAEVERIFSEDKPTYFYCDCSEDFGLDVFKKDYKELTKDGGVTGLYVLPEKLNKLSDEQISRLRYYGFNL